MRFALVISVYIVLVWIEGVTGWRPIFPQTFNLMLIVVMTVLLIMDLVELAKKREQ